MTADASNRMKIVVYYAGWAIVCTAVAGIVIALIHTWLFSYNPTRSALFQSLLGGLITALALAAGQGAVALLTGSVLAHYDRELRRTVLLGLLLGVFDLVFYFVQMTLPQTELGWLLDIAILVAATVMITLYGMAPRGAA
jgi:hypothetical protein